MKGSVVALIAGAVVLVGTVALGIAWPGLFLRGYLAGWVMCLGVALGSMGLVMMHHLTGGVWGWPVRRYAEAAMMTLPALAVAGIPLVLGGKLLFPWADAKIVAGEPLLQHRAVGFAWGFVLVRAVVYFGAWIGLAWRLRRLSLEHDRTGDERLLESARRISAAGLVIYFVTMSLAAVDWIGSREVDWYSSTFGLVVVMGQAVAALAFLIVTSGVSAELRPLATDRAKLDLGNLLQTTVVLWAYISFAQFLVIWIGNTQEDITWFYHRNHGGWQFATMSLVGLHFGLPFVMLLFQGAKRRGRLLCTIAAGLLVMRWVDVEWIIVPSSLEREPGRVHVLDLAVPVGLGLLWLGLWGWIAGLQARVPRAVTEAAAAAEQEASHGAGESTITGQT